MRLAERFTTTIVFVYSPRQSSRHGHDQRLRFHAVHAGLTWGPDRPSIHFSGSGATFFLEEDTGARLKPEVNAPPSLLRDSLFIRLPNKPPPPVDTRGLLAGAGGSAGGVSFLKRPPNCIVGEEPCALELALSGATTRAVVCVASSVHTASRSPSMAKRRKCLFSRCHRGDTQLKLGALHPTLAAGAQVRRRQDR